MITTPEALRALVAEAREAEAVALDTEFVWERTYYPHLGVVQLGWSADDVHLIDAAELDLAPLAPLLEDAGVVKLLHDAPQDLQILRRAAGAEVRNVFDTRLAAGFVGLGATISLQALLRAALGVHLPKGETRSDWLRRPLTAEQQAYALDDVRHLPALWRWLREQAEARGRLAWVEEEMRLYDDPAFTAERDPAEHYLRLKGAGRLSPRERAVLREVAAWREREARERNRPRGHVVPDDVLVSVAQRKVEDEAALGRVRGLSDNARKRYGGSLVEAAQRGAAAPKEDWPEKARRRDDEDLVAARTDLLLSALKGEGQAAGVDPGLVASRSDLEALVQAHADGAVRAEEHRALEGWRRTFVGERLLRVLDGAAAVGLAGDPALPTIRG